MIRNSVTGEKKISNGAEINLSPLIDCVFILLIFYIVTTVFIDETGIEVSKPEAASSAKLDKKSLLIAITEDNRVIYGGSEIGMSGVAGIVKRQIQQEDIPVIIQADERCDHGVFSKVYGEARAAGASRVNFSTLY